MCGFFKRNCFGLQKFLPLAKSPLVFAARSCGDLFYGVGTLCWGSDVGLGLLAPEISLPNFCLPHMGVGPTCSVSEPLLLVSTEVFLSCQTSI